MWRELETDDATTRPGTTNHHPGLQLPAQSRLPSRRLDARGKLRRNEQFWRTVNGNFLDLCVLEWCKLFAGKNSMHHWRKVVAHPDRFEVALRARLRLTKPQFDEYITAMCAYRDKFVAHLKALLATSHQHAGDRS